jgi:tetratricopeptide (TPR) repeat protein
MYERFMREPASPRASFGGFGRSSGLMPRGRRRYNPVRGNFQENKGTVVPKAGSSLRSFLAAFPLAILIVCFAASPAVAQLVSASGFPGVPDKPENLSWGVSQLGGLKRDQKEWAVAGRVMNLAGDFIPGASVQVSPLAAGEFRFFKTDVSGDFQTFYFVTQGFIKDFMVWLTVKKNGFQTAHELIDLGEFPTAVRLPITLRPDEPDANLLSQQDLMVHILPELKSLRLSDGLAAKSQKEYAKGVREFVEKGRPDHSLNDFLNVVKRNPACTKCLTMLALAELDSGDWDGASRHTNEAAQMTVKDPSGGSPESLLLGGVMESWRHNPQEATNFLAWADKIHPKDPLVLREIGRAQLQLRQFDMADAYLERAINAGAGPDARLLRVQALLGEDDLDAANAEMKRYLNGRNPKTLPVESRRIWAMFQNRKEIRTLYAGSNKGKRRIREAEHVDYLQYSAAQLKGLEPAKDQSELKPILAGVGENVAALFRDFQSTTSREEIHQEKLGRKGKVSDAIEGKFRYLCLMPSDPAIPGFTEYRKNMDVEEGPPGGLEQGYMLTSGFASAAIPLILAVSGLSAGSQTKQGPDQSASQLAAQAQSAMRAKDYPQAIAALQKLQAMAPQVAEVHADLGIAFYFEGRFADAVREDRQALRLKPSLEHAQIFLGMSLAESNHCAQAAPYLERDFKRVPDPQLKRMIGNDGVQCAMVLNHPVEAVEYLHALSILFPDDPDLLYLSSHVYPGLSTQAALRLLQAHPGSWQAHQLNAETLAIQGKVKKAMAEYRKVLSLNPRAAGVHYELGMLLLDGPREPDTLQQARHEFEEDLRINPGDAEAAYQLGEMAFEARQWNGAIQYFREAIRISPAIVDARVGLGKALISAGRPGEAVPPLKEAIRLQPRNAEAHYRLSFAYRLTGRAQDGNIDVVIQNMGEPPSLLKNECRSGNHWVSIKLQGRRSNRSAIGARITVWAGGRRQIREVVSGSSYISQSDFRQHFGLGAAPRVDRIEVRWPSGQTETTGATNADQFIVIEEGRGIV